MKIKDIIKNIDYSSCSYFADDEINSICFDSRKIKPGDVYFALKGEQDGAQFASDAVQKGAVLVVSDRDLPGLPCLVVSDPRKVMTEFCAEKYGHPEKQVKMIGVTGTNGKTTTAYILWQLYNSLGVKAAFIGTLGAFVGSDMIETGMTTPDPPTFFSLLSRFVAMGVQVVVCEVSAHAIYLQKVINVPFKYGVFTNLTPDHLDYFNDLAFYGDVKKSWLISSLVKKAVLNYDDDITKEILSNRKGKTITYMLGSAKDKNEIKAPKDYYAINVQSGEKTSFSLCATGKNYFVESPLVGLFNVKNLLAALAVLLDDDIPAEEVINSVKTIQPPPGRFNQTECCGKKVIVDYAHTPDGLKNVLETAKAITKGELLCVFGCGGNRDREKRPTMGKIAAEISDAVVITSDNPRWEDPTAIMNEILSGVDDRERNKCVSIVDRAEAIRYAVDRAGQDDLIVVAGKGAEEYLEIRGKRIFYSDYDVLKKLDCRIKP